MPDIILDLNLLVFAARAMEPAQENPHVTPFTSGKRDTKDPAALVLNKPQNKGGASTRTPSTSCAPSLLLPLSLSRAASLALPPACASSLPCALALVAALSLWLGAHAARQAQERKRGPLNKNLVQKIRARSLSLELPPALSPSRVLPLSCCLSHVRPLSCRRQAPMADGPDARERGGALLVLCRLTGLGAREVTLLPARTAIEMATTARAAAPILTAPAPSIAQQSVACPPRSLSPPLSLVCPSTVRLP